MTKAISETGAMIAGMAPRLDAEDYVFCTTDDADLAAAAGGEALAWFREGEGVSLVLGRARARELGFADDLPMRRIVLEVHSALEGVGLTAAVAAALSADGIPCNMVAAYHHDHVFVPSTMAERSLAILEALQAGSGAA